MTTSMINYRRQQWRNVAPVAPASPGAPREEGAKISNLSYLDAKMYHTSAKLTFGGGEKIFNGKKAPGGAEKLQGRQKAPGGARSL